jgi:hypothetical protein
MNLGLKDSFIYWNKAQSGTFGSSPRVKKKYIPWIHICGPSI